MLTKQSISYVLGKLITALLSLATLYAFTHKLSQPQYGEYALVVATAGLLSGFAFQWIRQGLIKFGTSTEEDRAPLLGTICALYLVVAVGVSFFALLTSTGIFGLISPAAHVLATEVLALALSQSIFEFVLDTNRMDAKPFRYSVASAVRATLCLVFGLLAAHLTKSVAWVIAGVSAGYIIAATFAAPRWLLRHISLRQANKEDAKRLATYGLPLALTIGCTVLADNADRFILATTQGNVMVGVYASAYNLAQYSIGALLSGLGLASFPLAIREYGTGGKEAVRSLLRRNFTLIFAVALPAAVGFVMEGANLGAMILGNFVEGVTPTVLSIVAIAVAIGALRSYAIDIIFMLEKKTSLQAGILASAAAFNVALNLLAIPRWGGVGAAIVTLLSGVAAFAMSIFSARKLIIISIDKASLAKIIVSAFLMAALLAVMPRVDGWLSIAARVLAGAFCYATILACLNLRKLREYFDSRLPERSHG